LFLLRLFRLLLIFGGTIPCLTQFFFFCPLPVLNINGALDGLLAFAVGNIVLGFRDY
jgi:hypothetical protein